jgi:AcrR family transcriptional regulator
MRASVATVDVREAILDAADRLLARYGYRKMTVDDLAADAGIGKGSVYLHFSSKEEVVISHVDRIVDRLCARMEQIAARNEPAASRLKAMLIERVVFRLKAVQHYTEALNDLAAAIRPKLLERRAEHFAREARLLQRVLSEGLKNDEFGATSPATAARAMIEASNALLPYSLSPQELGDVADVRRRVSVIADMLVRGLRPE